MSTIDWKKYDLAPFDLEKCMAGAKVATRSWLEYTFGAYKPEMGGYALIGWIKGCNGLRIALTHDKDGWTSHSADRLFMVVPRAQKYTKYVVVSKTDPDSEETVRHELKYGDDIFGKEGVDYKIVKVEFEL